MKPNKKILSDIETAYQNLTTAHNAISEAWTIFDKYNIPITPGAPHPGDVSCGISDCLSHLEKFKISLEVI